MSFFKNINIDIKEIPAGSKVKVGDVGIARFMVAVSMLLRVLQDILKK